MTDSKRTNPSPEHNRLLDSMGWKIAVSAWIWAHVAAYLALYGPGSTNLIPSLPGGKALQECLRHLLSADYLY